MTLRSTTARDDAGSWRYLTRAWGTRESVSAYLNRGQVATPDDLVTQVWAKVHDRRRDVGMVVDFGAGDGRFSRGGAYQSYIGYEIDPDRFTPVKLPQNAKLVSRCAFTLDISDADLCIGNPPYVQNQHLPTGWRQLASASVYERTGVKLSGLANAWQYFVLLSVSSTKADGLVVLVIPYEWVSRPSAGALREYIQNKGWDVQVYRLGDHWFDRVLTTSSITILDKRDTSGNWQYFEEVSPGAFRALRSASGSKLGIIQYARRAGVATRSLYARRGLSPGTQRVLTLTEDERVRFGLQIGVDVVACITTLRGVDSKCTNITVAVFKKKLRRSGRKCWLIRTDKNPSKRLQAYLDLVPPEQRQTATCRDRDLWWAFSMPTVPALLIASGFRGERPKLVMNDVGARAVGGIYGIYGVPKKKRMGLIKSFKRKNISTSVVAHSNGLRKLEVNQLNTLLRSMDWDD